MGEIYDFDGNIIGIIDIETGDVYNNNGDYLGCVEIGGGEDPEEGLYIDEMGQVFVNGVLVTDITEAGEMFDVDGNLIAVIDVETGDVYDINGKILGRLEIEENPDEPVMPDEPINPEEPVVPETNIYIDEMNQVVIDDLVFGVVNESGEIFCDGILVGIIIFETGDVYDISDNCLGNIYVKTNSNDNMNAE